MMRPSATTRGSGAAKDYYEMGSLWREAYWTDAERDRARQSLAHLPGKVSSALEIGCGAGVVAQELRRHATTVVGLDLAREPLRQVLREHIPAIQGSFTHLPFADRSFDLVVAAEVLEHLEETERRKTLEEIARVARRQVIVTVPYREILAWASVRCGQCGFVFHGNRHTKSFRERDVVDLLNPPFRTARIWTFGPKLKRMPRTLVAIGQRFGGYQAMPAGRALCPRCGNRERFATERNWMTHIFLGIPDRVLPLPKKSRYLAALFERIP